ncbi:MAG TPA: YcxB family protein, partial [Flavobacteriaceae bacterium]|nr:YcxB family protein [Flavobacteriaceae bacterium]
ITAILWFVFYPMYSKWRYKRHFKKHVEENYKNRINKPVVIDFSENSVNAKDFTSETKINGTELKELIETKNHFFIKLTTDLSLIVPKHSIKNRTEFKKRVTEFGAEYVDELNWKWK